MRLSLQMPNNPKQEYSPSPFNGEPNKFQVNEKSALQAQPDITPIRPEPTSGIIELVMPEVENLNDAQISEPSQELTTASKFSKMQAKFEAELSAEPI